MFSFGLFTSLFPYLILAVTSIVGWTTFTWANKEYTDTYLPAKVVHVQEINSTEESVIELFGYLQLQEFQVSKKTSEIQYNKIETLLDIPILSPPCMVSDNYSKKLFNRPPPQIC